MSKNNVRQDFIDVYLKQRQALEDEYRAEITSLAGHAKTHIIPESDVIYQRGSADGKHDCGYCHGRTLDDAVGNCAACGAPRTRQGKPTVLTVTTDAGTVTK